MIDKLLTKRCVEVYDTFLRIRFPSSHECIYNFLVLDSVTESYSRSEADEIWKNIGRCHNTYCCQIVIKLTDTSLELPLMLLRILVLAVFPEVTELTCKIDFLEYLRHLYRVDILKFILLPVVACLCAEES